MQGRHPKVRKARLCPHFRRPTLSRRHLTLVPKHSAGRQMCSARRTRVRTTDSGMRQTPVNSHLRLQRMRPRKADSAGGGLSLCGAGGQPPAAPLLWLPGSPCPRPTRRPPPFLRSPTDCRPHSGRRFSQTVIVPGGPTPHVQPSRPPRLFSAEGNLAPKTTSFGLTRWSQILAFLLPPLRPSARQSESEDPLPVRRDCAPSFPRRGH